MRCLLESWQVCQHSYLPCLDSDRDILKADSTETGLGYSCLRWSLSVHDSFSPKHVLPWLIWSQKALLKLYENHLGRNGRIKYRNSHSHLLVLPLRCGTGDGHHRHCHSNEHNNLHNAFWHHCVCAMHWINQGSIILPNGWFVQELGRILEFVDSSYSDVMRRVVGFRSSNNPSRCDWCQRVSSTNYRLQRIGTDVHDTNGHARSRHCNHWQWNRR